MPPPAPPTVLVPSERAVVLLSCALSALGSGLLVATHALWPDLRSRARLLLFFLSLADLLSAASYFYGVLQDFEGSSWDCVLQGAVSTFASTSSFFWTVAIALYLYLSIVRSMCGPEARRLLWVFHIVSWGVPLVITVIAVALKKIGYDASDVSVGWCWIDLEAEDRVLWMLLTGKLWELLAYVTLPVLYLLIRKHIGRAHAALSEYRPIISQAQQLQRQTSVADKKLVLIPLIFIFLRVWSTVRFILTLYGSPVVQSPVLVVLHVGYREHVSGRCQLHHVRPLHTRRPHPAPLSLLLLPFSAPCPEPSQGTGTLPDRPGPATHADPRRTSVHLSFSLPRSVHGCYDLGPGGLSAGCRERAWVSVRCRPSASQALDPRWGAAQSQLLLPPRPQAHVPLTLHPSAPGGSHLHRVGTEIQGN
ncbi:G-protein coupled receptor 157 isoform X1 [Camelus dromedarius]|uniref:G-protein coupled receptor 157 isoform X1 n=1 Tax=Camelus dromedarius TaxID=9838 RepID=UPI00311A3827